MPYPSPAANQFLTVGDQKRTWGLEDTCWEQLIKMILKCNLGPTAPQVTGHETKENYKNNFVGRKIWQKEWGEAFKISSVGHEVKER